MQSKAGEKIYISVIPAGVNIMREGKEQLQVIAVYQNEDTDEQRWYSQICQISVSYKGLCQSPQICNSVINTTALMKSP